MFGSKGKISRVLSKGSDTDCVKIMELAKLISKKSPEVSKEAKQIYAIANELRLNLEKLWNFDYKIAQLIEQKFGK